MYCVPNVVPIDKPSTIERAFLVHLESRTRSKQRGTLSFRSVHSRARPSRSITASAAATTDSVLFVVVLGAWSFAILLLWFG